jgi:hypothetical protein
MLNHPYGSWLANGDIALIHTEVSSPQEMSLYAIEVARRQPNGTWRWLTGDPCSDGYRDAYAFTPVSSRLQSRPSAERR